MRMSVERDDDVMNMDVECSERERSRFVAEPCARQCSCSMQVELLFFVVVDAEAVVDAYWAFSGDLVERYHALDLDRLRAARESAQSAR